MACSKNAENDYRLVEDEEGLKNAISELKQ